MNMTWTELDNAIKTRSLVRVTDRGYHKGLIGIALGYNASYHTVKVGLIDSDGKYIGEKTVVGAGCIELYTAAENSTTEDAAPEATVHLIEDTIDGGAVIAAVRATTKTEARDIWFNDLTNYDNLPAVAYENSRTNGDPFNGWTVSSPGQPITSTTLCANQNEALAEINNRINNR